ncbi:hypothetical protein [Streptomyces sp. NBC_00859]|uniref:hypothetical protein n=1 Tax=Streptomyces sp. NBC_00859 TaxID=2903682 RepID=UPI00387083FD|nr:hypothetical protein OG584_01990 [Streptomyces sp. NBC_00859]
MSAAAARTPDPLRRGRLRMAGRIGPGGSRLRTPRRCPQPPRARRITGKDRRGLAVALTADETGGPADAPGISPHPLTVRMHRRY